MISLARSLAVLAILKTALASIYVTFPVQGDSCAVSQPCQIKWKDDSKAPSSSSFGETTIDLVMGNSSNLQLAQNLGGVSNPAVAQALTFTPNSNLSPTQQFAIRFISKGNQSNPIFSTFFSITGGSGTAKPLTTSGSSSNSPAAIIGSKAPNALAASNATSNTTSSVSNATASENANKSGATSIEVPFAGLTLMIISCAFFKVL